MELGSTNCHVKKKKTRRQVFETSAANRIYVSLLNNNNNKYLYLNTNID